jgi:excinuclease UvrABC helicase subunit UvrB
MVEKYLEVEEDKKEFLQYKPYIMRMNAISRAMISLHKEMKSSAEEILSSAISAIESMDEIDTPAFQFERVRSLNYLKATLKQIHEKKPSPTENLKSQLQQAVEEEDYERAAVLRDEIRKIGTEEPSVDAFEDLSSEEDQ